MSYNTYTDFSRGVKEMISPEDVFRFFGVTLKKHKKTGEENVCSCPLGVHEDKHPSFSFNSSKGLYHCHACAASGDVFNLIAHFADYDTSKDFKDVFAIACTMAGVDNELNAEKREAFQESYKEALMSPKDMRTEAAEDYFKKKGVNVGGLDIEWTAVKDADGVVDIAIPMRDKGLKGEIVGAQRGRKKFMRGSEASLFYEPLLLDGHNEVYVVEGLSDWLTMIASGIWNCIGLASATTDTKKLSVALKRYKTVNICLDLDIHKDDADSKGSKAGAKKMKTMIQELSKTKVQTKVFFLGEGYKFDINDLYRKGGAEEVIHFFENKTKNLHDVSDLLGEVVSNNGYIYAKKIAEQEMMAIDNTVNFYWLCDKENKVWHSCTRGQIESAIMEFIEEKSATGHTSAMISDVINYLTRTTSKHVLGIKESIAGGEADKMDWKKRSKVYVNIKDGRFYVVSGKVVPYKPSDYVISHMNISEKEIREPVNNGDFNYFIQDIFKGDRDSGKKVEFIQEWMGYCLFPENIFQKMLLILGYGGNGKSTLLNCISDIVGKNNFTNIEINKFSSDRFAASGLLGTYVNICTDMERRTQLDNDVLKKITGGDMLTAEEKFKSPFQFRPFCKIIMASNSEPASSDSGDWLDRRLQIIEFNRNYTGTEDFGLEKKLKEEKGYIFRFCMEGLLRLLKRGWFDEPHSVRKKRKDFMASLDYMMEFESHLEEQAAPGFPVETNVNKLYQIFHEYMTVYEGRSKTYIPTKRRFVEEMTKRNYVLIKKGAKFYLEKTEKCSVEDIEE